MPDPHRHVPVPGQHVHLMILEGRAEMNAIAQSGRDDSSGLPRSAGIPGETPDDFVEVVGSQKTQEAWRAKQAQAQVVAEEDLVADG